MSKNIVVRMPNWIGDLVMATPILVDLKRAFPAARVTAMCRAPLIDLLAGDPAIDELFGFSKGSRLERREPARSIVDTVRKGAYDTGILLTHSFSSAWWFWLGGVCRRIGYANRARQWLLTESLPFPETLDRQHLVLTYKKLLEPLGIPLSDTPPQLYVNAVDVAAARDYLRERGIPEGAVLVGMNPGATYGSAKCWLPERFRQVTERLLSHSDVYILYFGDGATAPLVREICHGLPARVVNVAGGTSLKQLMALIRICTVLLTNDSGPMHIADAVGTPLVALFGSTSEVITGPYRGGTVIHKHVECSPCYERRCPIDFRCMKRIEVDEVYHAVCQHLPLARAPLSLLEPALCPT